MTATAEAPFPFADLALARRLERAEGASNARFVEARARAFPDSGARWLEVAGAYAMFDGVASPVTQTFGLGMVQPVTPEHLGRIEAFFTELGAPVFHEVCPLADPTLLPLLNGRGYQPMELTSVMFRPLRREEHTSAGGRVVARPIKDGEQELYAQTGARGWSETAGRDDFLLQLGRVQAEWAGAFAFVAELDGRAIGAAALSISEGVALLAGASTVPEEREQGAQRALLDCRLRYAVEQGCDLAMMGAAPGSASQRNAERHGFRIAYTRIKWRLPRAEARPEPNGEPGA